MLIKNDLASYTWLNPCENAGSDVAKSAISEWISCSVCMDWLVTDEGSHFIATLRRNLTLSAPASHHFTALYCPLANGTIERVCKEVIRTSGALLSEWKLPILHWPSIVDAIHSIINQSALQSLGKRQDGKTPCPFIMFTRIKFATLLTRPNPLIQYEDLDELCAARRKAILNIVFLQATLDGIHREVPEINDKRRASACKRHNRKDNVLHVNFSIGDYVMVCSHAKLNHKLQWMLTGPMHFVEVKSNLIFIVEDLLHTNPQTMHAKRMMLYPARKREQAASQELKYQAAHYDSTYHLGNSLSAVRKHKGKYEVRVEWTGFQNGVDTTWEPVQKIRDDVPELLDEFLHTGRDRVLKKKLFDLHF